MLVIMYLAIKMVINMIGVLVVTHTIHGVSASSIKAIISAAFVIGIINALIKPAVFMATLPLNLATLGVFTLVLNGLVFFLAGKFVKGFNVENFWSAFWAAIIFSVVSLAFRMALGPKFSIRYLMLKIKEKWKGTRKEDR